MRIIRLSKAACVSAIALSISLVAFGNITDYGANFAFVRHVMLMDTIFPNTAITYRSLSNPVLHHAAYIAIIAAETLIAALCWIGALRMFAHVNGNDRAFNRSKTWAIAGLAAGFLVWQVLFISIGGEWFGMWMSETWNGVASAFRFSIASIAVLIFVAMPDGSADD